MDKRRTIEKGLLIVYALGMLVLLFHRAPAHSGEPYAQELLRHVNLMPLKTIRLYWGLLRHPRPPLVRLAVINLAGNVVMFIPLGYLLPSAFPRLQKVWRTMLACTGIICLVELCQMVTLLGTCDIDDLILNLLGCAIGYGLHFLTNRKSKPEPT